MNTPIKIEQELIEKLDKHKDRLGFTRQRLTNNLLKTALKHLDVEGYEKFITLPQTKKNLCDGSSI